MVQPEFSLMHITREQDGSPVKAGAAITDLTTGFYAANFILASLYGRNENTQFGTMA